MADTATEPLIHTEYMSKDVIDLEQRRIETTPFYPAVNYIWL